MIALTLSNALLFKASLLKTLTWHFSDSNNSTDQLYMYNGTQSGSTNSTSGLTNITTNEVANTDMNTGLVIFLFLIIPSIGIVLFFVLLHVCTRRTKFQPGEREQISSQRSMISSDPAEEDEFGRFDNSTGVKKTAVKIINNRKLALFSPSTYKPQNQNDNTRYTCTEMESSRIIKGKDPFFDGSMQI
jgi:hypothetical protein